MTLPTPSTASGTLALRGEAPSTTADLDADLATLVARLQAAGSAIPTLFPDPDQAWRELLQAPTPPTREWSNEETPPPAWPHANGHADLVAERRSVTPLPRRGGGWVLAQLATAALLLLTLAVGFAAIRQRCLRHETRGHGCPRWCVPWRLPPAVLSTRR